MTVTLIFTWMHLSDAFIESDMFLNSFPHLMIVCVCFVQVWPVRSRSPATRTLMRWWRSGIVLQTCCWDPQTTPPVWTCGESPARLHPSHSKPHPLLPYCNSTVLTPMQLTNALQKAFFLVLHLKYLNVLQIKPEK